MEGGKILLHVVYPLVSEGRESHQDLLSPSL